MKNLIVLIFCIFLIGLNGCTSVHIKMADGSEYTYMRIFTEVYDLKAETSGGNRISVGSAEVNTELIESAIEAYLSTYDILHLKK